MLQLRRQLTYATHSGGLQTPFVCLQYRLPQYTTYALPSVRPMLTRCHVAMLNGGPQVPFACNTVCRFVPLHRCRRIDAMSVSHTQRDTDPLAKVSQKFLQETTRPREEAARQGVAALGCRCPLAWAPRPRAHSDLLPVCESLREANSRQNGSRGLRTQTAHATPCFGRS